MWNGCKAGIVAGFGMSRDREKTLERGADLIAQRSLAESVTEALLKEIVSGHLAPGQRVDLASYATRWGVSITPVRDAAKQLEAQGFLKVLARRGVFVSELTAKEVRDIFDVRIALESVAIRLATPLIPQVEIEKALRLYADAGLAATTRERNRLLRKIDALIHILAVQYCGNNRLRKMMEEIRDFVRWCQNTIIVNLNEPFLVTLPEHVRICEAVRDRDPARAEEAMRVHLTNTFERIEMHLAQQEGAGPGGDAAA